MAFRDFNDAGGVGGCKLVTDTRDSRSQGNVAVDQATQLFNIKKVPVIIGQHGDITGPFRLWNITNGEVTTVGEISAEGVGKVKADLPK